MPLSYLTKSAFAQAVSCHTKLYYITNNYPSTASDNEYLKFLAQGGFMVGALAQLMHPGGILMPKSGDPVIDAAETRRKILEGDCTLFEASVIDGRKLAITDILERRGDTLKLIEVKSKSVEGVDDPTSEPLRGKRGGISTKWLPYLYDIIFQYVLVCRSFPEFKVEPYFLLADKGKRSSVDALPTLFSLEESTPNAKPTVSIKPNASESLKSLDLLSLLDVKSEVKELLEFVTSEMTTLEKALVSGKRVEPILATRCSKCEFKGKDLSPNGYHKCWKGIKEPEHHIFDLGYGSVLQHEGELVFDKLISEKKISLFDIPLEYLKGKRGDRQRLQIECTKSGKEWIDPILRSFIKDVRYPLHFIDFETTRTALPFHTNMRPFEQIAFQWSCHTVTAPGAEPVHSEWINVEPEFPNFAFAKSLMKTLSADGTVLVWASHEGSVLTDILRQMDTYGHKDSELKEFLELMVSSKGAQGRLVDMNRLTAEHYFHPEMKGKTSIKKVLPAVMKANNPNGEVIDPYKNLPPIVIAGSDVTVQEGTAAMRAYEEMIFGKASKDPVEKEKWRKLLLQYCKLDTWAMWVIWGRWTTL